MPIPLTAFLAAAEVIYAAQTFDGEKLLRAHGWTIDAAHGPPRFSRCVEFVNPDGPWSRQMTFEIIFLADNVDAYKIAEDAPWRSHPIAFAPPATIATPYVSPTGRAIIGTREELFGHAEIEAINPDGSPVYSGETKIWWDDAQTMERHGRILFVDEEFSQWTFDQLTPVTVEAA